MIKFFVAVALVSGLSGCGCDQDDMYAAYADKTAKLLRSPGSAKFQPVEEAVTKFTKVGDVCAITVNGWVDSQNSFGALVRSDTSGTVFKLADGYSVTSNVSQR